MERNNQNNSQNTNNPQFGIISPAKYDQFKTNSYNFPISNTHLIQNPYTFQQPFIPNQHYHPTYISKIENGKMQNRELLAEEWYFFIFYFIYFIFFFFI